MLRRNPKGSLGVAFGTRGMLRRNPKGSLGVAFGTRGTLRRNSEGVSRCGFRDTWHAPKEFRRGLSVWALGHVACSEGIPKGSLGVGFGTRGMLRRNPEGGSWFGHSR